MQTDSLIQKLSKGKEISTETDFKKINGASEEKAHELEGSGRWIEAGNHIYSLCEKVQDAKRVEYFILLAQYCINLGNLDKAKVFLEEARNIHIPKGEDLSYKNAEILQKEGWIHDYEGEFAKGKEVLEESIEIINSISSHLPQEKLGSFIETSRHFIGRAIVGLAMKEGEFEELKTAEEIFKVLYVKELALYEAGGGHESSVAFNLSWLSLVKLLQGKIEEAKSLNDESIEFFKMYEEKYPLSGIMAYPKMRNGMIFKQERKTEEALKSFKEAFDTWESTDKYKRGMAVSLIYQSRIHEEMGEMGVVEKLIMSALDIYPLISKNPYF